MDALKAPGEFAHDRYRNLTGENVTDRALDGIQVHLPVPEVVDDGVDLVGLGYTGKVSRCWSPFGSARDTTTSQDRGGFSDDLGGGVGPAGDDEAGEFGYDPGRLVLPLAPGSRSTARATKPDPISPTGVEEPQPTPPTTRSVAHTDGRQACPVTRHPAERVVV